MEMTTREKANQFFRNYIIELMIIMACAVYMLRELIDITPEEKSVLAIIASAFISLIFGFTIAQLFQEKGLMSGKKDERFLATLSELDKAIRAVIPYVELLEPFCREKNEAEKRNAQTIILSTAGLVYDKFIAGAYDTETLSDEKKEAVRKAAKVKVFKLTTPELMSEESKVKLPGDLGKKLPEFRAKSRAGDMFTRVIFVLIFAYFGVGLVEGFSWSSVIWAFIQMTFFLISGVIKYVMSYIFITEDYRNRLICKTTLLQEFYNITIKRENEVQVKKLAAPAKAEPAKAEPAETVPTKAEPENETKNSANETKSLANETKNAGGESYVG
jgi:hypothetical protein